MNILFVSHLTSNVASGPNWSVPASVNALSEFDNVLWVNMTDVLLPHWKDVKDYHNISDYGSLKKLPIPFDKPDLVVFEGFYFLDDVFYAKWLRAKRIPYIIVPRGSFTWQALHNEARLKKVVAHVLFFNSFIRNATAIQYLTKKEQSDSMRTFSTRSFIVPNGFNEPSVKKSSFFDNGVKAVFVGRLGIYHKGIDNLLKAISEVKEDLRKANFTLEMYGPAHQYDYDDVRRMIDGLGVSDIVFLLDAISGKEKEQVLLGADLFILTSRLEGHPMGLIEALAYGLPSFVSPGSNMKEEIEEYNAGWVCDGEVQGIRDALLKVIVEKDKLGEKGLNAQRLASIYNWRNISEQFHNEIEGILSEKK